MNRAVADERRAGNEESGGAAMSGAERVEPEVSPTPGKAQKQCAHKDVRIVCLQIVLFTYRESEKSKKKKIQWNLNNPWS